jgi:hypothetical protein
LPTDLEEKVKEAAEVSMGKIDRNSSLNNLFNFLLFLAQELKFLKKIF